MFVSASITFGAGFKMSIMRLLALSLSMGGCEFGSTVLTTSRTARGSLSVKFDEKFTYICGRMHGMTPKHWSVHNKPGANLRKWELEERINFGIGEEKISADILRAEWDIIDIDPWKRKALALALE